MPYENYYLICNPILKTNMIKNFFETFKHSLFSLIEKGIVLKFMHVTQILLLGQAMPVLEL